MTQVKEMLLFAAGIIITVSLIFVGFTVFSKALNIGSLVSEQEDRKIQILRTQEIEKYEGQEIQGNKIVSYVRSLYGTVDAYISITVRDSSKQPYAYTVDNTSINELRNEQSAYFINPMKKYSVTVIRDKNDSITGIEINEL